MREVVRGIQDTRKKLDLPIEKRVDLVIAADEELTAAIQAFDATLRDNVLVASVTFGEVEGMDTIEVGSKTIRVRIT